MMAVRLALSPAAHHPCIHTPLPHASTLPCPTLPRYCSEPSRSVMCWAQEVEDALFARSHSKQVGWVGRRCGGWHGRGRHWEALGRLAPVWANTLPRGLEGCDWLAGSHLSETDNTMTGPRVAHTAHRPVLQRPTHP